MWVGWVSAYDSCPDPRLQVDLTFSTYICSLHGSGSTQHVLLADPQSTGTKLNQSMLKATATIMSTNHPLAQMNHVTKPSTSGAGSVLCPQGRRSRVHICWITVHTIPGRAGRIRGSVKQIILLDVHVNTKFTAVSHSSRLLQILSSCLERLLRFIFFYGVISLQAGGLFLAASILKWLHFF